MIYSGKFQLYNIGLFQHFQGVCLFVQSINQCGKLGALVSNWNFEYSSFNIVNDSWIHWYFHVFSNKKFINFKILILQNMADSCYCCSVIIIWYFSEKEMGKIVAQVNEQE